MIEMISLNLKEEEEADSDMDEAFDIDESPCNTKISNINTVEIKYAFNTNDMNLKLL
jgi:hypothetical protein